MQSPLQNFQPLSLLLQRTDFTVEIASAVSSVIDQGEESPGEDELVEGEPRALELGFGTCCLGHTSSKIHYHSQKNDSLLD